MPKILVTEPEYFDEESRKILSKYGTVTARRYERKQLEKVIGDYDVIVVRIETHLDSKLLAKAKKLKIIGSATTGLNHIDLEYAKRHGIKILNLHGMHTVPTAEHTMALMLSLARKIPWAYEDLRNGDWKRYLFIGTQLEGKCLGIIGFGRIGRQVAKYAREFGMSIIAYDPYVKSKSVKMVQLKTLLKESDIISIHAMLTPDTKGMIGAKEFGQTKKTALLVNTARGEIVNQKALINALKSGRISGAAEDVFPEEPIQDRNDLVISYARKAKNLIITPHIAASTDWAVHSAAMEIATDVAKELERITS